MTDRSPTTTSPCADVFLACDEAIQRGTLIRRVSRQDKEFHFQGWLSRRLRDLGIRYEPPARNTYSDFRLVEIAEGYEVNLRRNTLTPKYLDNPGAGRRARRQCRL